MENQTYTPDWASIPAKFNWVTVDKNGDVFAYEKEPQPQFDFWHCSDSLFQFIAEVKAPPSGMWKTMLYKRPKPATT